MYEEIARIIYKCYYDKDNKKYIYDIYEIVRNYMGLDEYVKDLVLKEKDNGVAEYFQRTRIIEIDPDIEKVNYGLLSDEYNKELYFYINLVDTIFHELDHAKYYKERDEGSDDIIHKLSEYGDPRYIAEKYPEISTIDLLKLIYRTKKIYNKHHDMVPIEHRAIYNALLETRKVIDELLKYDFDNSTINFYLGVMYQDELLNYKEHYKKKKCGVTNSPSYDYCNYVAFRNKFKPEELLKYKKNYLESFNYDSSLYSLEERIKYGLQLNNYELDEIIESKQNEINSFVKKIK